MPWDRWHPAGIPKISGLWPDSKKPAGRQRSRFCKLSPRQTTRCFFDTHVGRPEAGFIKGAQFFTALVLISFSLAVEGKAVMLTFDEAGPSSGRGISS